MVDNGNGNGNGVTVTKQVDVKKTRNDVEVGGMVLFFSKTEVSLILVGTIVSTVSELIVFYASTFFIIFFLVPQFTFAIL